MSKKHLFIPDTQVREGVPTDHLEALGNYIVDKKPDVIVIAGDFADFPSVSVYGTPIEREGQRLYHDIGSARNAMLRLLAPLEAYNSKQQSNKKKLYRPRMVLTMGNHEYRLVRYVQNHPELMGWFDTDDPVGYTDYGWEVIPYERIINIDGIRYSHLFRNPQTLKKSVLGGTIDNKLNKLGWSFTMGHQQHLQYGIQHLSDGGVRQGLVAGAFYQHNEGYLGEQGNDHWRGVVLKHEVHDGRYDPCFVSLNYLLDNWL